MSAAQLARSRLARYARFSAVVGAILLSYVRHPYIKHSPYRSEYRYLYGFLTTEPIDIVVP
jgi:hypothetical protein